MKVLLIAINNWELLWEQKGGKRYVKRLTTMMQMGLKGHKGKKLVEFQWVARGLRFLKKRV